MRFNLNYFYLFLIMFLIELVIALFIHDSFIRPFVGDVLVVILLYYFIRTFFKLRTLKVAIGVLIFSFIIEMGQYYDLVTILNLQNILIARIVIGSTFDIFDLLAYALGAVLIIIFTHASVKNTLYGHWLKVKEARSKGR